MHDCFFDSNVLLYAVSRDSPKANVTASLLEQGGSISVQVLNEVARVCVEKWRRPWVEVHQFLAALRTALAVHPMTMDVHRHGLELAERHKFQVFDAMIVAAALEAGCDTLWSKDMQHGMLVRGQLRIIDPFHPAA